MIVLQNGSGVRNFLEILVTFRLRHGTRGDVQDLGRIRATAVDLYDVPDIDGIRRFDLTAVDLNQAVGPHIFGDCAAFDNTDRRQIIVDTHY